MAASETGKQKAWAAFDQIVANAAPSGIHSNPWRRSTTGVLRYEPDTAVLERLLSVPHTMQSISESGVLALALDVWLSYELRRAGFDPDATWPRATHPRILPLAVSRLLKSLPKAQRQELWARIRSRSSIAGVSGADGRVLGKNYLKQVDVIMSDWDTGPEVLISTKRMDSSWANNASNRVEEAYGDAKNLRVRHPLAALGFLFCVRSTIYAEAPAVAARITDLLQKLGEADDAYHSTCLVVIEYSDVPQVGEHSDRDTTVATTRDAGHDELSTAGTQSSVEGAISIENVAAAAATAKPVVRFRPQNVPRALQPDVFLHQVVQRVLDAAPVDRHVEARDRIIAAPRDRGVTLKRPSRQVL